jgi:acetylornithine deacetylase
MSDDDALTLVSDLVQIPSRHGSTAQNEAQDTVLAALAGTGAQIDDWIPDWAELRSWESPLDKQRLFVDLDRDAAYRDVLPSLRCVAATVGSGPPHLVINSHVDVVTADPESQWTSSPYRARLDGDRLYARGSMDAKGGLAAGILALRELARTGLPAGTVTLLSVPEEETGGNGTLAALHRGYIGDGVILCEPSDLRVIHRHIGLQQFNIEIDGRPGGILRRSWGDSALTAMGRVLRALELLQDDRTRQAAAAGGYEDDDLPGYINVGTVSGGEWLATRAAAASACGVMSVLPGERQADAEDAIRAAIERSCADVPWFAEHPPRVVTPSPGQRGAEIPASHPLVTALLTSADDLPSDPRLPRVAASRAGTMVCDAKTISGGGFAPSVVFGPVGGGLHSPDEWVGLPSIGRCASVLVGAVRHYLGAAADRAEQ